MFGLSFGEIAFLGILALLVVGPKQLPELARYVGRLLNDIKRSTEDFTGDLKRQAQIDFDWDEYHRPKPPPQTPPEQTVQQTETKTNPSSSDEGGKTE